MLLTQALKNLYYSVCQARIPGQAEDSEERYMIKAVPKDSREAAVIRHLLSSPEGRQRNSHIIPAELVDCSKSSLIIMPRLVDQFVFWEQLGTKHLLGFITQAIEVR